MSDRAMPTRVRYPAAGMGTVLTHRRTVVGDAVRDGDETTPEELPHARSDLARP